MDCSSAYLPRAIRALRHPIPTGCLGVRPMTCRGAMLLLAVSALLLQACGQPVSATKAAQEREATDHRVATFAVRAVAVADLLDPAGDFSDYQGLTTTQSGWRAEFDAFKCAVTPEHEGCVEVSSSETGRTTLWIEVEGSRLRVVRASGPFGPDNREKLLNYTEEANEEPPEFVFPTVQIRQGVDEGLAVQAASLWTGDITPQVAPELTKCHIQVFNARDEQIYEGRAVQFAAPTTEAARSGDITSFGILEDLDAADDAKVTCT